MNRAVEILHAILERFRLHEPVPSDIRDYIAANKRNAAADVLRHYSEYSFAYGAAMAVFYGARRMGYRLTMRQSRIALGVIITMVMVAATVSLVIIFNKREMIPAERVLPDRMEVIEEKKPHSDDKSEKHADENDNRPPEDKKENAPSVRFRLGVEAFSSDAVDTDETRRITDVIAGELIRLKGADKVVKLGGENRRKSANLALLGSVEKLGSTYIITAKIVDVQSGRVTASFDESADNQAEVDAACRRLAARAAGKVE